MRNFIIFLFLSFFNLNYLFSADKLPAAFEEHEKKPISEAQKHILDKQKAEYEQKAEELKKTHDKQSSSLQKQHEEQIDRLNKSREEHKADAKSADEFEKQQNLKSNDGKVATFSRSGQMVDFTRDPEAIDKGYDVAIKNKREEHSLEKLDLQHQQQKEQLSKQQDFQKAQNDISGEFADWQLGTQQSQEQDSLLKTQSEERENLVKSHGLEFSKDLHEESDSKEKIQKDVSKLYSDTNKSLNDLLTDFKEGKNLDVGQVIVAHCTDMIAGSLSSMLSGYTFEKVATGLPEFSMSNSKEFFAQLEKNVNQEVMSTAKSDVLQTIENAKQLFDDYKKKFNDVEQEQTKAKEVSEKVGVGTETSGKETAETATAKFETQTEAKLPVVEKGAFSAFMDWFTNLFGKGDLADSHNLAKNAQSTTDMVSALQKLTVTQREDVLNRWLDGVKSGEITVSGDKLDVVKTMMNDINKALPNSQHLKLTSADLSKASFKVVTV